MPRTQSVRDRGIFAESAVRP
eukprot:COSAG01_NODE_57727_length_310_cov_1.118483_1_plen_20_part_01